MLIAPAAVLGHLGAISLKNLTKRKEIRKLEKELIRPKIINFDHLHRKVPYTDHQTSIIFS